ncbi:MAG: hypothetical protein P8H32_05285 [Oceanicoccus sp.]|uniref:hypothetical protein n=1 Tax=Oceanicoccus sp. TaxID=2691044 RepID=UPI00262F0A77|nr:hypothetical protein [Oceanicoccus sp.]MDG1772829.1 hypothetical protein [Oceanicoccus sp.]
MSTVFVVRNQDGYFATKQKEWECGREPKLLFRSLHKDEALNIVFELSSKDIYLRAEAISVELDEKKQPVIEVTAPPKAKPEEVSVTEKENVTPAEAGV